MCSVSSRVKILASKTRAVNNSRRLIHHHLVVRSSVKSYTCRGSDVYVLEPLVREDCEVSNR